MSRFAALALMLVPILSIGCASAAEPEAAPATPAPAQPVSPGEVFPGGVFENLNAGGSASATVELGYVIGTKPVVLYYWIAGHERAERVFRQLQELALELGEESFALYGVSVPRPDRDVTVIRERLAATGITVPVLNDKDFRIGRQLQVQSVPNISILDREGRLRLTNGGSLTQELEYQLDVAGAIRRAASGGVLITYGALDRYHPVTELVGRECPDFRAPLLADSVEKRWHGLLDNGRLNVLIFWSVDCPHCRKSLPRISQWVRDNPEGINVYSAANVTSEENRAKTRDFCRVNGLVFPTLVDRDAEIGNLYNITSTPTVLIIRPDGIVDSVILSSSADIAKAIAEKKRTLLGS